MMDKRIDKLKSGSNITKNSSTARGDRKRWSKMYGPQSAYGTTLKTQAGGLVPTKEKHGAAWGISAFLGPIAGP